MIFGPPVASWDPQIVTASREEVIPCWATDAAYAASCSKPGIGRLGLCPEHQRELLGRDTEG